MHQPRPGTIDSTPHRSPRPRRTRPKLAKEIRRYTALQALERSFAYEFASGAIAMHCLVPEAVTDEGDLPWYDLSTRDTDLADHVRYLQSRHLLEVHPDNPGWVRLCDEGEPITQVVQ